jgi:hypothetical protein
LPNFAKDFGLQKKAFCFILFCVRKFSLWYFLLFGCLFVSVARESKAQGTLDSLTIPAISGAPVIGYYVSGGVGWSFVPTSDILVTGIEASAIQFSFWQGSNQVLATFNVSSPNTKPPNSFAPIAPLFLSAGELYFVSCQNSNFSDVVVFSVWGLQGAHGLPSFGTSSYISEFASYRVSPNRQWSPTVSPPDSNTDVLLYGPNFQFKVVPEPSAISISIVGLLFHARKLKPRRKV